ncbi:hypothetical protein AAC387_Pa08g1167 [Persea americana]
MAALFDGTSATGDDKWALTMDGVPADIITDMDSSFYSLNGYDDTPSPNETNSQPTMREDATTSDIGPDVTMANIRRKRPRPSTKGSNNAVNDCIIKLAASVQASNQLAAASAQSKGPTVDRNGQKWMPRGIQLQMSFGDMLLLMLDFYHLMSWFILCHATWSDGV